MFTRLVNRLSATLATDSTLGAVLKLLWSLRLCSTLVRCLSTLTWTVWMFVGRHFDSAQQLCGMLGRPGTAISLGGGSLGNLLVFLYRVDSSSCSCAGVGPSIVGRKTAHRLNWMLRPCRSLCVLRLSLPTLVVTFLCGSMFTVLFRWNVMLWVRLSISLLVSRLSSGLNLVVTPWLTKRRRWWCIPLVILGLVLLLMKILTLGPSGLVFPISPLIVDDFYTSLFRMAKLSLGLGVPRKWLVCRRNLGCSVLQVVWASTSVLLFVVDGLA